MDDPYGRVSDEEQARYAIQAYQRAQSDWPWTGVINYWFFKRPSDAEQDQPWYYFRLLEPDFSATQAWDELSEYTANPAEIEVQTQLQYTWQQLRPALALISGSILFYLLLGFLSPEHNDKGNGAE
jgi:hypothetical protein